MESITKKSGTTLSVGSAAEDLACAFFQGKSYELVARNFRWKGGEIDLVFVHSTLGIPTLVFVEVRSAHRKSNFLRSSIQSAKQARIQKTIAVFMSKHKNFVRYARRFDVAWVEAGVVEHWKNVSIFNGRS